MTSKRIITGAEDFDIDAREAQVVGPERVAPLKADEFSDEARGIVENIRAQFGIIDDSDVPSVFAVLFKHPGLFRSQMLMGVEFGRKGCLPPRERELAILRVGWLARAPYEWGEHVGYGREVGLSDEEIERVTHGSDAPGWGEHDRTILRAVEELLGDYAMSTETWQTLAKNWSEQQLMELLGVVGAYLMTALVYNSLRFELLPGNSGLRQHLDPSSSADRGKGPPPKLKLD